MKQKLYQILLGAIGSAVSVLIAHFANASPEVVSAAGIGVGSVTPSIVDRIAQIGSLA